jgi:hypothetical protein
MSGTVRVIETIRNRKIKTMKKICITLLIIIFFLKCSGSVKDDASQHQTYGNSTENTKVSSEKIDGSNTFEVYFTLDKPAECMSVVMETVYLQKIFPLQKIPKKTYFIVEKKLKLPQFKSNIEKQYTPLGRNFNNDWELYSPVKICTNKNDPLSVIDVSEYRIRFTSFEKSQLYYILTISCESKIIFKDYVPVK